jgi:hypothetical protein
VGGKPGRPGDLVRDQKEKGWTLGLKVPLVDFYGHPSDAGIMLFSERALTKSAFPYSFLSIIQKVSMPSKD